MKKVIKLFSFITLLILMICGFACKEEETPPEVEPSIVVTNENVRILDTDLETFNFKSLFTIKKGDEIIPVIDSYIDKSSVKSEPGIYYVYCKYENLSSKVFVEVYKKIVKINLKESNIRVSCLDVKSYDFNALFEVLEDNEKIQITPDMVTSDVSSEKGNYEYTVTYKGVKKTLYVEVYVPRIVSVTALKESVEIKTIDVKDYKFDTLFSIKVNGKSLTILPEYLDITSVKSEEGEYTIYCEFEGNKASVLVKVKQVECVIESKVEEVTLNLKTILTYDFKKLFTVKVDGKEVSITDDMIETDIKPEIGEYSYSIKLLNKIKTIKVYVKVDHIIEIYAVQHNLEINENQVSSFDYTSLFLLYVDGVVIKVTNDMIDLSSLSDVKVGENYSISLTYTVGETTETQEIIIKIIPSVSYTITPKNIVIYPNSDIIDLTTLFEIKKDGVVIPTDIKNITGNINYNEIGVNEITLNFDGKEYKATVEIKRGVVIDYRYSDTIQIVKGTNKNSYVFENDFLVRINGIQFTDIPESFIDSSNVNFDEIGTYECKLTIPYNDKKFGLSGVKFTYFEKTINYVVIENDVRITVLEDTVKLIKDTKTFDPLNNIKVVINGKNQTLTYNPDYIDIITCYVKVLSNDVDLTKTGLQEVIIEIYGNGKDSEPMVVSYYVSVESDIKIESFDKTIFRGETVYPKDLFTLTRGDKFIEVKNEYITGKLDLFTPGVYYLTINYEGVTKDAKVVVLNSDILGTYETDLTTIPGKQEENDDEDIEYPYEEYSTLDTTNPVRQYGKLIINGIDDITLEGKKLEFVSSIDENTLQVKRNGNLYTLYYNNGIVVLDPDNSIKLQFNENKRPLIYFNELKWELINKITINRGENYVLEGTITTYSIDTFKLKSKTSDESIWYGLMVDLYEKSSYDTVYNVTWGVVEFASSFKQEPENLSTFTFNGKSYNLLMTSESVGKTNVTIETEKTYALKIFKGEIEGKAAELRFDQYEGMSIYLNNIKFLTIGKYEFTNLLYGGLDKTNDIILTYSYSEKFYSYKFKLNYEELTFELLPRDMYYGYYESDSMYIFLDGYGGGIVNFDKKSYYRTIFEYEVDGQMITCDFLNTSANFEYGKQMIISIDSLLNILTVRYSHENKLAGLVFINQEITDGAIVNIESYKVGQASDKIAKAELYSYISIITKNGKLDEEEMKKVINTSFIRFNTPGYYEFTITLPVNGVDIVSYYAVEILEEIYKDNNLVNNYNQGAIFSTNSISIDKYGKITVYCGDIKYSGNVKINGNTFFGKAKNEKGNSISLTGELVSKGVIIVRSTGTVSFNDIFSVGDNSVCGSENIYLRSFKINDNYVYILSESLTQVGKIVSLESINGIAPNENGSIIKIDDNGEVKYYMINKWNDVKEGILLSDKYRGEYTLEGNESIFVDGFSSITVAGKKYSYTLNGNIISYLDNDKIIVYRLNNESFTYEIVDFTLDNSKLEGKSFQSTYKFACGVYSYEATTTFLFLSNGMVRVTSSSESHDDDEQGCTEDVYNAKFAGRTGTTGKFSIKGNIVKVEVNGYTFEFEISNMISIYDMKCTSTNYSADDLGYFATGTVFTKAQ